MKYLIDLILILSSCLSISNAYLMFDMSHDFGNETMNWPGATRIKVTPISNSGISKSLISQFWELTSDIQGEVHLSTHIDAPRHFAKGKWTVDEIPIERFFGPVSIVDLRSKVKDNADYEITANDLIEWEITNRKKLDPLVVLWTGWSSRYPDRLRYMGTKSEDEPSNLHHFPGLSQGAAEWLVKRGGIHGVGIDTASMDYGQSKEFMAHRVLSEDQIFIMEYLNTRGLESFPMVKPYLMITPLKITGGSGSPARAIILSQFPEDKPSVKAADNQLAMKTNSVLQREILTCRQLLSTSRMIFG